jgi:hypothetical protein
MGGVKGSPRMAAAVRLAIQHPTLTQVQVFRIADYIKGEASSRNKQKFLSKRRCHVETDNEKEKNRLGVKGFRARRRLEQVSRMPLASIEVQSVSSVSVITDTDTTAEEKEKANALSDSAVTNGHGMSLTASDHPITAAISTASLSSSNTNRSNGYLPLNRQKGLAQKSWRTPQQKAAFEAERIEVFKCKRIAYRWAVQHVLDNRQDASKPKTIQYWASEASEASEVFGVDVKGDTI